MVTPAVPDPVAGVRGRFVCMFGVRAAASCVGRCCRRRVWQLKYNSYENISPQRTQRTQSQCNNVFAAFAVSVAYINTTPILYAPGCLSRSTTHAAARVVGMEPGGAVTASTCDSGTPTVLTLWLGCGGVWCACSVSGRRVGGV